MPTQNLYPNATSTYEQWDTPLLTDHYLEVDEVSQDGDTTWIADSGVFTPNGTGPKDSFNLDSWTLGNKLIEKVEVIFWAKYSGGTNNKVTPFLIFEGNITGGTFETLTTSWTEYTQELSRPGGGNWQYTDLDSLEVGVIAEASTAPKLGQNIRVTMVYVKITYISDFSTIQSNSVIFDPYPTKFYLSGFDSDLSG